MRGRVAARKLLAVLVVAERAGLARAACLAAIGLRANEVSDPEGWVPQEAWRDLWAHVVRETGDPHLGIRAAAGLDPGYFGVIDYAARSAATLGEAIPLAARYFRLANTWGRLEQTPLPDGMRVSRHVLGDEGLWLPRQAAEFALGTMVRVFRLAAMPFSLAGVRFRYPKPEDDGPLRAFFACPVAFGCPEDAVDVSRAALAVPMRAPDPRLRALVESHGTTLLAALDPAEASTAAWVRHHLARRMSRGAPTLDEIARDLGLSDRTLQRRLAEEGTSLRAERDAVRSALSQQWLGQGMAPGEVAFLLGYAEVSAFHRAFVGWTGQPPGAWARERRAGAKGAVSGAVGQ